MTRIFEVDRVVRSRVPILLQAEGVTTEHRYLTDKEALDGLLNAAIRAINNIKELPDDHREVVNGIAEADELLESIKRISGVSPGEIDEAGAKIRAQRGGYGRPALLQTVELEANNPLVAEYQGIYPEIHT